MVVGALQFVPSNRVARPRPAAAQKVVVGHETEARDPALSICCGPLQSAPSERYASPALSTATQKAGVAQEIAVSELVSVSVSGAFQRTPSNVCTRPMMSMAAQN